MDGWMHGWMDGWMDARMIFDNWMPRIARSQAGRRSSRATSATARPCLSERAVELLRSRTRRSRRRPTPARAAPTAASPISQRANQHEASDELAVDIYVDDLPNRLSRGTRSTSMSMTCPIAIAFSRICVRHGHRSPPMRPRSVSRERRRTSSSSSTSPSSLSCSLEL